MELDKGKASVAAGAGSPDHKLSLGLLGLELDSLGLYNMHRLHSVK